MREHISLVSQETTLFDDTILNNIKYANLNASTNEIKEAARLSFAEEFINSLPNKFDTIKSIIVLFKLLNKNAPPSSCIK